MDIGSSWAVNIIQSNLCQGCFGAYRVQMKNTREASISAISDKDWYFGCLALGTLQCAVGYPNAGYGVWYEVAAVPARIGFNDFKARIEDPRAGTE